MEIKKTELEEPRHGYNVFVKHTVHHQDFADKLFDVANKVTAGYMIEPENIDKDKAKSFARWGEEFT